MFKALKNVPCTDQRHRNLLFIYNLLLPAHIGLAAHHPDEYGRAQVQW